MMAKKKRNPQDSTLRNVRSAKKHLKELEARVTTLEQQAHDLWSQSAKIQNLDLRLTQLQDRLNGYDTGPVGPRG